MEINGGEGVTSFFGRQWHCFSRRGEDEAKRGRVFVYCGAFNFYEEMALISFSNEEEDGSKWGPSPLKLQRILVSQKRKLPFLAFFSGFRSLGPFLFAFFLYF
ncbi:hypothetical protein A4A49_28250 [Nicotiana attenuata]|uniref:Uncharacterized protein n=1 Tax=Nicotiana attenuata TaxID=49451 RepID=A0A314LCQ0_NICAT|nr:hypothetical protein A4A49_28250 [Nicotiana attenuata]